MVWYRGAWALAVTVYAARILFGWSVMSEKLQSSYIVLLLWIVIVTEFNDELRKRKRRLRIELLMKRLGR